MVQGFDNTFYKMEKYSYFQWLESSNSYIMAFIKRLAENTTIYLIFLMVMSKSHLMYRIVIRVKELETNSKAPYLIPSLDGLVPSHAYNNEMDLNKCVFKFFRLWFRVFVCVFVCVCRCVYVCITVFVLVFI